MEKKPPLFAIFAHPDDEAFGPSGYIIKATEKYEVHVICVTDGGLGKNTNGVNLAKVRQEELLASAKVLGVTQVHLLHYEDGMLSNCLYHEVGAKIAGIIDTYQPETILTFEPRGLSGHLDHIAVTSIVNYLYDHKDYIKQIHYFAFSQEHRNKINDYFVFMPPGYTKEEIAFSLNIEDVWDKKIQAFSCHQTQKDDAREILRQMEGLAKEEHFLVVSKAT